MKKYSELPLVLAQLLALTGCLGVSAETNPPKMTLEKSVTQIILKYKDQGFDPSSGDYLRKLSLEIGTNIIYVRRMSGDSHVLRIEGMVNAEELRRAMDCVTVRPEVEWVEQDRLMRHQSR